MQWGRVDVTPFQVAQMQRVFRATISIYPPGTTRAQRGWLAVRGLGTTWLGLIPAFCLVAAAAAIWVPAGIAMFLVLVGVWVLSIERANKVHGRIRRVHVTITPGEAIGDSRFDTIAKDLDHLDASSLDPVAYELGWGEIYSNVESSH